MDRYQNVFGAAPPEDIWPAPEIRFAGKWRRIDTQRYFMVPRPAVFAAAIIPAFAVLAACGDINSDTISYNKIVFGIILTLMIGSIGNQLLAEIMKRKKKRDNDIGDGDVDVGDVGWRSDGKSSSDGGSGCGGGGGCGGGD